MTRDEERTLFAGTIPIASSAISIDDNGRKLAAVWEARDLDQMLARLKEFHRSLGLSMYRLSEGSGDKVVSRIARDARTVCERVGWHWICQHSKPQGSA